MGVKREDKPGKGSAKKRKPNTGANQVRNAAIRARVRALLIASVPPTEIYPLLAEEFSRPAREIRLRHDEVKRDARDTERKNADAYWQWLLEANIENLARLQAEKDWRGVQGQLKQLAELTGADAPKRLEHSGNIRTEAADSFLDELPDDVRASVLAALPEE